MREPRFMVFKDKLFFYFFTAGKNFWTFDPQSIWASECTGSGNLTEPREIWDPEPVVSRPIEHKRFHLIRPHPGRTSHHPLHATPPAVHRFN